MTTTPTHSKKFDPRDHLMIFKRRQKQKDAQGKESWITIEAEYLPVAWRIYWFRLENPTGVVDCQALNIDFHEGIAFFQAFVQREDGGNARLHGSETREDWKDFCEKAETKALGRALAALGYGTQFTDQEFFEGERIVDSPLYRDHPPTTQPASNPPAEHTAPPNGANNPAHQPASTPKATAQQIASIRKLYQYLQKSIPTNIAQLTNDEAKERIQALTTEYHRNKNNK
ncbi:hypothetical protein [Dictyobacter kobayashii]|nr:hypothetical protein [Dictyobacter kobayashii]